MNNYRLKMDWNKRFLFMLLMIMTFISGSDLLAQVEGVTGRSDHITGQVFDQQGEPLVGVAVYEKKSPKNGPIWTANLLCRQKVTRKWH